MAKPSEKGSSNQTTVLIISICVVFCTTIAAVVALAIAAPSDSQTIGQLVGLIAPTIASLVLLARVSTVEGKVDEANHALNGEMDAKIQRNVSSTLERHGVPPVTEK